MIRRTRLAVVGVATFLVVSYLLPAAKRGEQPSVLQAVAPQAARAEESSGPRNITFDDIKLELKKDEKFVADKHLTEKVEKLDGKKIKIRGWIHPAVFSATGIKKFVLVRDNQECCFGPGAALHDCIYVTMAPGKSTDFTTKPISVEGTFRIEEFEIDGRQMAIYQMTGEAAK